MMCTGTHGVTRMYDYSPVGPSPMICTCTDGVTRMHNYSPIGPSPMMCTGTHVVTRMYDYSPQSSDRPQRGARVHIVYSTHGLKLRYSYSPTNNSSNTEYPLDSFLTLRISC